MKRTSFLKNSLIVASGMFALDMTAGGFQIDPPAIDVHGFGSIGYIQSSGNDKWPGTQDGTLEFNEFAVNFTTQLTEKVRAGAQLLSRDLTDFGNNKVFLDWAYVDYRHKGWLGAQVGKIKIPRGLYNETRDIDLLRTSVFMPSSLYSQNTRDLLLSSDGGGVYGSLPVGSFGYIDYRGTFGSSDVPVDGASVDSLQSMGLIGNANSAEINEIWAASLIWSTPVDGLRFGASVLGYDQFELAGEIGGFWAMVGTQYGLTLDPTAPGTFSQLSNKEYTLSAEYIWNRLTLVYEYQQTSFESELSFLPMDQDESQMQGYYLSGTYQILDRLSAGLMWDVAYLPIGEKSSPQSYQKSYVMSFRYDITPQWLVKVEHHLIDGYGESDVGILGQGEKSWTLSAIKTTYSF